jgi:hypothetical protein
MSSLTDLEFFRFVYSTGAAMTIFYLIGANTYNANRYIYSLDSPLDKCVLYPISIAKSFLYGLTWPISLFVISNKGLVCPMYNFGSNNKYKQFYDQM